MFGATLAANDRRLAEATLTLTGESETGGFVNALPMLHSRWMPHIDPVGARRPSTSSSRCARRTWSSDPLYVGEPTVSLYEAPGDELAALEPHEMIAGYWRQVGATFVGGSVV